MMHQPLGAPKSASPSQTSNGSPRLGIPFQGHAKVPLTPPWVGSSIALACVTLLEEGGVGVPGSWVSMHPCTMELTHAHGSGRGLCAPNIFVPGANALP